MASNFRIFIQHTNGSLQLNLKGNFDGSSAFELLNMLEENLDDTASVFINTSNLKEIHPFGRTVLKHNIYKLKKHQSRIRFVGENARRIAPFESEFS